MKLNREQLLIVYGALQNYCSLTKPVDMSETGLAIVSSYQAPRLTKEHQDAQELLRAVTDELLYPSQDEEEDDHEEDFWQDEEGTDEAGLDPPWVEGAEEEAPEEGAEDPGDGEEDQGEEEAKGPTLSAEKLATLPRLRVTPEATSLHTYGPVSLSIDRGGSVTLASDDHEEVVYLDRLRRTGKVLVLIDMDYDEEHLFGVSKFPKAWTQMLEIGVTYTVE